MYAITAEVAWVNIRQLWWPLPKPTSDRSCCLTMVISCKPTMTGVQCNRIRECICSSSEAALLFCRFPSLWENFDQPYDVIAGKVYRLYGGLDQALYTSHPFDFRPDSNRPLPWFRALLSNPGGLGLSDFRTCR